MWAKALSKPVTDQQSNFIFNQGKKITSFHQKENRGGTTKHL